MNRNQRRTELKQDGPASREASPAIHEWVAEALQHHQSGRLNEAEALYRRILEVMPRHADSLRLLGVLAHQTARNDLSVEMISKAIAIDPKVASWHHDLGTALAVGGRLDEAVTCYRGAIALQRDFPEAHFSLGNSLRKQGLLDQAVSCYRAALYLRPNFPGVYNNLGSVLGDLGRLDEAIACHREALGLRPDFPEAQLNLGVALQGQGLLAEAANCYRGALDLKPDYAEALYNLGNILRDQGRLDEAFVCLRDALGLRPDYAEAHNNLGNVLRDQGHPDQALACFRTAVELRPKAPDMHNNMGTAFHQQGRLSEAISCYRAALDLRPDLPDGHFNLALALLAQGEMATGWKEHEWRWKTPQMITSHRDFSPPQWRGEAAPGLTLLIHAEQGFGDTLQFCRYASMAAAEGLRVIIEAPKPLVRLLRGLHGVDQVVATGDELPKFDIHCPLLSMPLAFGTIVTTIPGAVPYLHADEEQVVSWHTRLSLTALTGGPRIGLVWSGNPRVHAPTLTATDRRRSLAPERLAPLFDIPGLQFFSLQKDGPAPPKDFPLIDYMNEMTDFADTAALIANLDLVISVDTSVAHLAAALGKPVWLLDRFDSCWRWLTGRRDSPWYPTLRIYRQPAPGDWDSVVAEVVRDLRGFAGQPGNVSLGWKNSTTTTLVEKPTGSPAAPATPDVQPVFAVACHHHLAGRLSEAEQLYRQVLSSSPRHAGSLHFLGLIARQTDRLDLAIELIRSAIASNPKVALYHSSLGNTFRQRGQLNEAIACYRAALEPDPAFVEANCNLGDLLSQLGRLDEAAPFYRKVLDRYPENPIAQNGLGNVLSDQGLLDEAVACFRRTIHLAPDFLEAHCNLGNALRQQKRLDEAIACYQNALSLNPNAQTAHFGLATVLLAQGNMARGWPEFEWRRPTPGVIQDHPNAALPWWRGEAGEGRTLLIEAEGGLGDTLQFCRYAPYAAARGLKVIMGVQRPLGRLLQSVMGVDRLVMEGEIPPDFDLFCPMFSLPLAFGTDLASVPSATSYLRADDRQVDGWRERLASIGNHGVRIGLVWAGNPRVYSPALFAIDRRRSLAPERLTPLFDVPGLRFFSLQKDGPASPKDLPLIDYMNEMTDFADTAALIANLDLVISVDTAVVHLAGALGKPVWMLDRFDSCWRWLTGRRDSPWYPTLRIYRQPAPGDWDSVLAEVARDLHGIAREGGRALVAGTG
jgi:tetratricopeptide (TPR) repeat protein